MSQEREEERWSKVSTEEERRCGRGNRRRGERKGDCDGTAGVVNTDRICDSDGRGRRRRFCRRVWNSAGRPAPATERGECEWSRGRCVSGSQRRDGKKQEGCGICRM